MKFIYLLTLLFLAGCASALKTNEDNLAPVYEMVVEKKFSEISEAFKKVKMASDNSIYYWNGDKIFSVGRHYFGSEMQELIKSVKECEKLTNSLETDDDYNYFTRSCLSDSSNSRSPLKIQISKLRRYSNVSLKPLFFDNNSKFLSKKRKRDDAIILTHQKDLKANDLRKAEIKRLKILSKKPEYKKCKLQSELIDSKKMLKMWNKNIDDLKSETKRAGQMTYKMERSMDKSLSFVRTYKLKIKDINRKLSQFSNVQVSGSSCKKMIPNYGRSNADQYM